MLRADGKYKETIETSFTLLQRGLEVNDHKSMLVAYLNSAASYYCIGDIEEAFHSIDAYDEICSKFGDETDVLQLYNVLLLLYEYNKDYVKAKETLEKSIRLGTKLEKFNIVSNGYSNYSHLCLVEEDYEKALEMAKTGLEMARLHRPASEILEIRVKLNIAESYIGLHDFYNSRRIIDEVESASVLEEHIRERSQFHMLKGSWYSNQGHLEEALVELTQARDLVMTYDDLYLLEEIQAKRCALCEKMDDLQQGFVVQKEYIGILKRMREQELALMALKLEVKHSLSVLEKKANTDPLTGISNRYYLESTASDWLSHASERCENVVCIVLDIDNFKRINDTHGHLFGDEVVREVGQACSGIIRDSDVIARYGGDEFVFLLKDVSLASGVEKASEILQTIRDLAISHDGQPIPIAASVGVADNGGGAVGLFKDLFHLADLELYTAKRKGRNRISVRGKHGIS